MHRRIAAASASDELSTPGDDFIALHPEGDRWYALLRVSTGLLCVYTSSWRKGGHTESQWCAQQVRI